MDLMHKVIWGLYFLMGFFFVFAGIGRLLTEAQQCPIVLPYAHVGKCCGALLYAHVGKCCVALLMLMWVSAVEHSFMLMWVSAV